MWWDVHGALVLRRLISVLHASRRAGDCSGVDLSKAVRWAGWPGRILLVPQSQNGRGPPPSETEMGANIPELNLIGVSLEDYGLSVSQSGKASGLVTGAKPFYSTRNGAAFLGDAKELLPKLADESINLIFTSP